MQEGEPAPNFELIANDGNTVSLDSFKDKQNVVLCFYPKNHIFGCPSKKVFKMAENVISSYPEITATDSELFTISVDNVEDQAKFVRVCILSSITEVKIRNAIFFNEFCLFVNSINRNCKKFRISCSYV